MCWRRTRQAKVGQKEGREARTERKAHAKGRMEGALQGQHVAWDEPDPTTSDLDEGAVVERLDDIHLVSASNRNLGAVAGLQTR